MNKRKTAKIDYSLERLSKQADQYYNEGKYVSALRLAYRQYDLYGSEPDIFVRLCDIYEGMGLHGSALNWWYRFLDIATEDDLPEIYEGIAVNYLNLGNEAAAAYYYNQLINADAGLPEETKQDIIEAFSQDKNSKLRFVYPPKLADYSKEIEQGGRALKAGDCKRAIQTLDLVAKGAKGYEKAKEMQAVAYLLSGDEKQAENVCLELLQDYPNDVRVLATLSAVYLEQGRAQESKDLALRLYSLKQTKAEELYKVATVCCENGLHEEAYQKFCLLEKEMPYDGRMLYFKAVAAYKSGRLDESEKTLSDLCAIYPDAEVAKFYLHALRLRDEEEMQERLREMNYFYHVPKAERESRCRSLIHIGKSPKDEAQLFGLIALHDGYFRWCFDEMDGAEHDLQYLALATAEHVRADEFIREVLLDSEVMDVLKVETLRMLYNRNEDMWLGIVLCHIYRKIFLLRLVIGRKKRKRFIAAYAKAASKFVAVKDSYGKKLKATAESLYKALETQNLLDMVDNEDDLCCAMYLLSGIKELGSDVQAVAGVMGANAQKVQLLLDAAHYQALVDNTINDYKETTNEMD